jgi:hypothetical protein
MQVPPKHFLTETYLKGRPGLTVFEVRWLKNTKQEEHCSGQAAYSPRRRT